MIALYLLTLMDSISVSVVVPLLGPLLIDDATQVFMLGAPLPWRSLVDGLLVAVYAFLMLYMAPVLGNLSDQVGRRRVLLACGVGVFLGNLLAGLAIAFRNLPLLFVGRIIAGATAAGQPTAQAALVDLGRHKALHLSLSLLFSSLGFVVGPVIASAGSARSMADPFYFCAGLTALAVVMLVFSYRDTRAGLGPINWKAISLSEGVRCFADAARERRVRGVLGSFLAMQVAWGSYFLFVSIFLMQSPVLDMNLHQVGIFMSVMGVGFCLATGLIQPLLARRLPMRVLAVGGLLSNAAVMVLCLRMQQPTHEYLAALAAGITVNIAFPSIVTILSNRVEPERQGWILGMVGSAAAMGWGVSSILSGALGGWGHELPVLLAAALMVLAGLGMLRS